MSGDVRSIYLDYAASSPLDPRVLEAMLPWMQRETGFGNPSSIGHMYGREAAFAVETARNCVAALIGGDPAGVVFTSGATESNNLAVLGAVRFAMARNRGRHVVTSRTEHSSVVAACARLEREGAEVTWLVPDREGRVTPDAVAQALRDDTVLVSLMHVNNETGVLQDVEAVAALLRDRRTLFHVDAAQSGGRCGIQVEHWGVDLLSLSAHKLYGPKGVGALWVRPQPRVRLEPLLYGGGQERGYRAGTLAVHQIVGMGEAYALARAQMQSEVAALASLRDRLASGLLDAGAYRLNGGGACAPHIVSVTFGCVHGEALALEMEHRGLALSAGSACASGDNRPSHVLRAMGLPDSLAIGTFRFSIGRWTTEADVDRAVSAVRLCLERLRAFSPLASEVFSAYGLDQMHGVERRERSRVQ